MRVRPDETQSQKGAKLIALTSAAGARSWKTCATGNHRGPSITSTTSLARKNENTTRGTVTRLSASRAWKYNLLYSAGRCCSRLKPGTSTPLIGALIWPIGNVNKPYALE